MRPPVRDRLAQELQQRLLLHRQSDAHHRLALRMLAQHLERLALHVLVEEARADVRRAAHRRRVPELLGRRVDGALELPLALRLARTLSLHRQRDRAEERPGPGAEVLGREVVADDGLDVLVDVAVLHVAEFLAVDEREELLRLHHLHVLRADRRQAVRRLRLRTLVVADAEEALVDEADDRGEHALAIELAAAEIGADAAAQLRQRLAELDDAAELLLLAPGAEAVVVAVLRAALLVDADGLQRRGLAAGDPHVLPRRRNAQLADALQRPLVGDRLAVRVDVVEAALLRALPPEPM